MLPLAERASCCDSQNTGIPCAKKRQTPASGEIGEDNEWTVKCSWLFAGKAFFNDALNEVLETVAVLNGVDLNAAVKVSANLKRCGGRWRWWSRGHSGKKLQ
jgi:hypothetical protein